MTKYVNFFAFGAKHFRNTRVISKPPVSRRRPPPPRYLFGSSMLRPLRLAYGLAPVIEVLEAHGHDISPLLSATDIPRFALEEPSYRIRFDQELNFIRRALATLARPTAGLEVGMRYNLAGAGGGLRPNHAGAVSCGADLARTQLGRDRTDGLAHR